MELVAQGNVLGTYTSSPIELFSLFMEKDRYVEIAVRFRLHSGQLLGGQASLCFQILEANGTRKSPSSQLLFAGASLPCSLACKSAHSLLTVAVVC